MNNISSSTSNKNVVDTAAANGSFKTFGNALRQAGMADTLKGEGPFTLFAPTDAAFAKLPPGQLDTWLKPENKEELISILNYHVLAGRSSAMDVGKLQQAKTVNGQSAPIVVDGVKVSIDGAELTLPDLASSNGVLHGIDKVNIPTRH
ncbi:MAG TPA: fasciclin domain-containing protein [Lysobacter sp.]